MRTCRECGCHSYNGDSGTVPERILTPPWSAVDPYAPKTVCIDACIADAIQHLWDRGIVTHGSCCGHGEQHPSVITESVEAAFSALREVDDRDWIVYRWELREHRRPARARISHHAAA